MKPETDEQHQERELLHRCLDAMIDHGQTCPGPCTDIRRYELVRDELLKVEVKREY